MESLYFIYHELRPEPSRYLYALACEEFQEHCTLFRRLQQQAPSTHLRPEVTFDDGHASALEFALPILQAAQVQAHFFITAGWTGRRPDYMTVGDLLTLQAAGMHLGAHGWSHKLLTACTDAELAVELRDSRRSLEDWLGTGITTMSLPGGRSNARVRRACLAAGYTQIFTSTPRTTDTARPQTTLGRFNVRAGMSVASLEALLQPGTGAVRKQQRIDMLKTGAKAVLGDRLYARLWGLLNHQEANTADSGVVAP